MRKAFLITLGIYLSLFAPCYSQALQEEDSQQNIKTTKFSTSVESVIWNPDGTQYITTEGNKIHFWDAKTDKIINTKEDSEANVLLNKISQDGTGLVTIYDDNTFIVQDLIQEKYFVKEKGTSKIPVFDAVFYKDFYTLLLPIDGKNIYSFFCLLMTNSAHIKQDIKSNHYVYSMDIDPKGKNLLVTYSNGTINLINTETKKVIQEIKGNPQVSISSSFSKDGKYFLYPLDTTTLKVRAVDGSREYTVKDYDNPVNTARISPNGKSLVVADKNGYVKIYNIEKAYVEDALELENKDIAFSCAFSPDGKSIIIGTRDGKVIRWEPKYTRRPDMKVPPKQIIIPENQTPVNNLKNTTTKNLKLTEKEPPTKTYIKLVTKRNMLPTHNIFVSAGVGTINSKKFLGNIHLKSGYMNYKLYPFYWGGDIGFSVGLTGKDFPYHYQVGNIKLPPPILLGLSPNIKVGFNYLFEKPKLLLFAELSLGSNIRVLSSSSIQFMHFGKPTASFAATIGTGFQWRMFRTEVDFQLDTNFIYSINATMGVVFPLQKKTSKGAKK